VTPLDVITYGEAMVMLVAEQAGALDSVAHFTRRQSGAETNVAIGLARLGLRVGWVSRVGDDSFGRFILRTMQSEGVDCSHVQVDARYPTGFQLKAKADQGKDPAVEYFRRGSAASRMSVQDDFDTAYFSAARHLHATGICCALSDSTMSLAVHAMDFMRAAGKTISFDPNLRPTLWPSEATMIEKLNALAAKARWVLPGLNEGRLLTGRKTPHDIAGFYLDQGAELVVLKLGPEGAYFRSRSEESTLEGVRVERVVDTVGAGDGFAVGVVSALLEGRPLRDAVARGNLIGSLAVQVVGDMEGLPTRAELQAEESRIPATASRETKGT
jgi:2-dehydro-3-deoxygluconokinase